VTVGADKGYDTRGFVAECRQLNATPHVSQNAKRPGGSALDARTTRHAGYNISQHKRKRIEECFGWLKTIALLRKLRHRGIFKVGWIFTFAAAGYNLVRMRKLLAPVVPSASLRGVVCPECRLKPSGLPNKADQREKSTPDPPKPPTENQPGENVTPNSYFFRTLLGIWDASTWADHRLRAAGQDEGFPSRVYRWRDTISK
jgi:hypothetical protein